MAKLALLTASLLLVLALTSAAPAETPAIDKEPSTSPVEAKEDLEAENGDLKPAASHWGGGWGYGGHWGGHWGGHYPYYGGYYGGYPSWGYGYGWPYYGGGWGYGHHGYWW